MKSKPLIIFFIDALPFKYKHLLTDIFEEKLTITETLPELGYSSNQHWAMFAGLLPDELGYFTDINLKANSSTHKSGLYIRHTSFLNFFIRYVEKRLLGLQNFNLPFGLGSFFEDLGRYPLNNPKEFNKLSILSGFNLRFGKTENEMDLLAFLENANLSKKEFVSLSVIDHLGHKSISQEGKYSEGVISVLEKVRDVWENFKKTHGKNSEMIIVSDHGMTECTIRLSFELETRFGKQGFGKYFYQTDAVIAKIWTMDLNIDKEMKDFFPDWNRYGHVLSKEQRDYFGVKNNVFGDYIFVLDPPYGFEPNYFGFGARYQIKKKFGLVKDPFSVGLHGYMPTVSSQHGLFAFSNNFRVSESTIRNRDIYTLLKNLR